MGKKNKKRNRKSETHPTIFAIEGEVKCYEDGSMMELYTQITPDEWKQIVEETVRYGLFIECLKATAFPILKEQWTKEDEWWRLQFEVAVGRMRQIDPMAFVTINQDAINDAYTKQAQTGADEMVKTIKMMHSVNDTFYDPSSAVVSDL